MNESFVLLLIIGWFVSGAVGFTLLNSSGRGWTGFALGALLGPVGWIVAAIMRLEKPTEARTARARGTTFCSNCGTAIDVTARYCNACGHQVAN